MNAPRSQSRYLVIEGPIGVGKTTLATRLADRFNGRLVLESVEENPFLSRFYNAQRKYAFQTQLFFLLSRFQQQQELGQQDLFSQITVADYLLAKDHLFAALNLDENELGLYQRLYQLLEPRAVKPDLVIYLQARQEVLQARIKKRGRDFEKNLDPKYLAALSKAYNEFFFHYTETPLLVVNTSDIDIVDGEADLDALVQVITRHKKGVAHYIPESASIRAL